MKSLNRARVWEQGC